MHNLTGVAFKEPCPLPRRFNFRSAAEFMKISTSGLIDPEMTGLEPAHDRILEIATVVTDSALNIIATGPILAISRKRAS